MDTETTSRLSCRQHRAAQAVHSYARHRPEETVLYQVVDEHLKKFDLQEQDWRPAKPWYEPRQ